MRKRIRKQSTVIPIHCNYDELASRRDLLPHPRNTNSHSKEQIALLAKIIQRNGWRDRIVVSNLSGFVVKGHGRLEAAEKLKLREVPVEYQDYKNDEEEFRDLVADNKIAELSAVNPELVLDIMSEMDMDMDLSEVLPEMGFTDSEIEKIIEEAMGGSEEEYDNSGMDQEKENLRRGIFISVGFCDILVMPSDERYEVLDGVVTSSYDYSEGFKNRVLDGIVGVIRNED